MEGAPFAEVGVVVLPGIVVGTFIGGGLIGIFTWPGKEGAPGGAIIGGIVGGTNPGAPRTGLGKTGGLIPGSKGAVPGICGIMGVGRTGRRGL